MSEKFPKGTTGAAVVPLRGEVGRNRFKVGLLEDDDGDLSPERREKVIERLQVPTDQGGIDSLARDRKAARARFAPLCESLIGEAIKTFVWTYPDRRDKIFPLRAMAPTGSEMARTRTMAEWMEVFRTAGESHPRLVRFMTDLILPSAIERASEGNEGDGGNDMQRLMSEAKEQIPSEQGNPWRVAVYGGGQGGREVSALWGVFLESAFRGPGSSVQYTEGIVRTITDYDEAHRLLSTEHPGRTIFLPVSGTDEELIKAMGSARASVECFVPVGLVHNAIAEPMIEAMVNGRVITLKTEEVQQGDGNLAGTVRVMADRLFRKWVFDDLGGAVEDAFKLSPRGYVHERLGYLMTALYLEPPVTWGDKNSWHARVEEAISPFIQAELEALTAEEEGTDAPGGITTIDLEEIRKRLDEGPSSGDFSRNAQRPPWLAAE